MTDELKECREAFEEWAEKQYLCNTEPYKLEGPPYKGMIMNASWQAWQAGWGSRTKPEGVDIEAGVKAMRDHEHLIGRVKFKTILPVAEARGLAKACASAWHLTAKGE